jgi:hypothetical protein
MTESNYFHVIMPVASDPGWQKRRAAIEKAASRHTADVRFPNYLPQAPTFRLSDLKQELLGATFVLVDLTHERPSCYYELGLAEALGVRVQLVAECGTPIHQSAARDEVRYYANLDELEAIVDRAVSEFVPVLAKASS